MDTVATNTVKYQKFSMDTVAKNTVKYQKFSMDTVATNTVKYQKLRKGTSRRASGDNFFLSAKIICDPLVFLLKMKCPENF